MINEVNKREKDMLTLIRIVVIVVLVMFLILALYSLWFRLKNLKESGKKLVDWLKGKKE